MRDVKEKKVGGLMILYKNNNFLVKKIETIHKNILVIQCQLYSLELRMILVYMSVPTMMTITNLDNMFKNTLKILRIISFWVILIAIQDS